MLYASRYQVRDYCHQMYEALRYLFVGTAIIHVHSFNAFQSSSSFEMLAFAVSILGESLLDCALNVETYFMAEGEKTCIRNHTRKVILFQLLPKIAIYCLFGVNYFFFYFHFLSLI